MQAADTLTQSPQGLSACLERLRPLIDDTIDKLRRTEFREDPIAGRKYSRATSIISSAYKRHGQILERALLERLKDCPRFEVWSEDSFKLSHESLNQLRIYDRIEKCLSITLPYGDVDRAIPIDIVVFDSASKTLRTYNVKRGNGAYDAGKRRIILGELLRVNMLLLDYGRQMGRLARVAEARIVFYYGLRSLPEPLSLVASELDAHFGFSVVAAVEHVNAYFKRRLHAVIEEE
jgi:hypothetical protein